MNPQIDQSIRCYIEPSPSTINKKYQGFVPYLYTSYKWEWSFSRKKRAKYGGKYNMNIRVYFHLRLPNGKIFLNRNLWFLNFLTKFNKNTYYCKQLDYDCFEISTDSLIHHRWYIWSCCYVNVFLCFLLVWSYLIMMTSYYSIFMKWCLAYL